MVDLCQRRDYDDKGSLGRPRTPPGEHPGAAQRCAGMAAGRAADDRLLWKVCRAALPREQQRGGPGKPGSPRAAPVTGWRQSRCFAMWWQMLPRWGTASYPSIGCQ
jgi:hypothetical protein